MDMRLGSHALSSKYGGLPTCRQGMIVFLSQAYFSWRFLKAFGAIRERGLLRKQKSARAGAQAAPNFDFDRFCAWHWWTHAFNALSGHSLLCHLLLHPVTKDQTSIPELQCSIDSLPDLYLWLPCIEMPAIHCTRSCGRLDGSVFIGRWLAEAFLRTEKKIKLTQKPVFDTEPWSRCLCTTMMANSKWQSCAACEEGPFNKQFNYDNHYKSRGHLQKEEQADQTGAISTYFKKAPSVANPVREPRPSATVPKEARSSVPASSAERLRQGAVVSEPAPKRRKHLPLSDTLSSLARLQGLVQRLSTNQLSEQAEPSVLLRAY